MSVDLNAVRLVAILAMSNEAEEQKDAWERRRALNEMQAAIQGAKDDIEALAEGLMFATDDDPLPRLSSLPDGG